jgi:hypothetical protein
MFIPTFFIIATTFISLFTFANALPTNEKLAGAVTEPRSLLGRQYRDVRVRRFLTTDFKPLRRFDDVVPESAEPITRSDRFHAIQRRRAEIGTREERLPDHGKNLLSNQSFGYPPSPAVQTPMPIPSPSSMQSTSSSTSVALLSDSTPPARTVRVKHSKGKKSRGKEMKA